MQKGCSCIIPFFNEADRVLETVKMAKTIKNIDEIICVDDGSTDSSSIEIAKSFPDVTVIRLHTNMGKTDAIRAGLKKVTTENTFLLDADLNDNKPDEYFKGIQYILDHPKADMLVFRQTKAFITTYLTGSSVSFSGQRIIKTEMLNEILSQDVSGYQIEVAINQYCIDNKKTVYWTNFSAKNTFKVDKFGFVEGLAKNIKMAAETTSYAGFPNHIKQSAFFMDKRIPEEKLVNKIKKMTLKDIEKKIIENIDKINKINLEDLFK